MQQSDQDVLLGGEAYFYCFSSNSRPLYLQNMLNVLALPHNSIHRSRYDAFVVPQSLHPPGLAVNPTSAEIIQYKAASQAYKNRLKTYEGAPVLITLVSRETNCKEDTLRFFPLRRGQLRRLEWEGDILYVDYKVGDYVDWTVPDPFDFRQIAEKRPKGVDEAAHPDLWDVWRRQVCDYFYSLMVRKFGEGDPDLSRIGREPGGISFVDTWFSAEQSLIWRTFLSRIREVVNKGSTKTDVSDHKCARMLEALFFNLIGARYTNDIKINLDPAHRPCDVSVAYLDYPIKQPPQFIAFAPEAKSLEAWQAIIEGISGRAADGGLDESVISQIPHFTNTVFYRVGGMRQLLHPRWSWLSRIGRDEQVRYRDEPICELLAGGNGYILKSGREYELDLSFYQSKTTHEFGSKISPGVIGRKIIPKLDGRYFAFEPQPITVAFRYDKRSIRLVTTPITQDVFTTLTIEADSPNGDQSQAKNAFEQSLLQAPQVNLLLKIREQGISLIAAFVLLFLAQVMIWMGTNLVDLSTPISADTAPPIISTAPSFTQTAIVPANASPASTPSSGTSNVTVQPATTPTTSGLPANTDSTNLSSKQPVVRAMFILGTPLPEEIIRRWGLALSGLGALLTPLVIFARLKSLPSG